jgi:hypothetical protein
MSARAQLRGPRLARLVLAVTRAANGSWRICEKVSVSLITRHPGDSPWNGLLGQRSDITVDLGTGCCTIAADTVATAFDTTATCARDAALAAADAVIGDSVIADSFANPAVFAKRIAIADAGRDSSGIGFEGWISVEQ